MADMREIDEPIEKVVKERLMFSLCELQDEKNRLISHCRIVNAYQNTIELRQTNEDAIDPNLPFGMPLKINVFGKDRRLQVLAGIAFGFKDNKIIVAGAEMLRERERREFFRVPISEDGIISQTNTTKQKLPIPRKPVIGKSGLDQQFKEIKVEDVSLSGLQFFADDEFNIGDTLMVEFAPLNQPQRRLCEIVRKKKTDEKTAHYGCRFLQMREYDLNELSRLIMKIQQSTRAKMREYDV